MLNLIIKGGRHEIFPLGNAAVDVIKRNIGTRKEGYVVVSPRTGTRFVSIHKSFNLAVRKLGLTANGTNYRFHDLRHVLLYLASREGVSLM